MIDVSGFLYSKLSIMYLSFEDAYMRALPGPYSEDGEEEEESNESI